MVLLSEGGDMSVSRWAILQENALKVRALMHGHEGGES